MEIAKNKFKRQCQIKAINHAASGVSVSYMYVHHSLFCNALSGCAMLPSCISGGNVFGGSPPPFPLTWLCETSYCHSCALDGWNTLPVIDTSSPLTVRHPHYCLCLFLLSPCPYCTPYNYLHISIIITIIITIKTFTHYVFPTLYSHYSIKSTKSALIVSFVPTYFHWWRPWMRLTCLKSVSKL